MHSSIWLWLCFLVLLSWGALGLFQKLAMKHISAETALLWAAAGFMVLQPLLWPNTSILDYSARSLGWALVNGVFNGLGLLSLMAAMRRGGKASIVEPLSALYPVFVVLLAPTLLHESIKPLHGIGIACAVIGGMLLSVETVPTNGHTSVNDMAWSENEHFKGWHCSECSWAVSAIRVDTTVAVLAFNRAAQKGFEKHHCVPASQKPKARARAAGKY